MRDFLVEYSGPCLIHHGILGQKWGVRRYQNKDGSLTLEGRKRLGIDIKKDLPSDFRLQTQRVKNRTESDRDQIKEIQDWENSERRHIFRGKQLLHQTKILSSKVSRIFEDRDSKNHLPIQNKKETADDTLKRVNPSKGTHLATGNNCCLCTIAYDLRRRGYDVIANQNAPINLLWDIGPEDVSWMYGFPKETNTKTASGLQKALEKEPDGSRGAAFCSWNGGHGGHVVAYEIINGRPILMDAQTGDKYTNVSDLFDDVSDTSYIRLDNKEPNYNFVKIAIE